MKRNLKTLGLVLTAVFAISAFAASAASAVEWKFKGHSGTTHLSGKQVGTDVFTTHGGTVSCGEATYTGTVTGPTATEVTVTPTYSECTAFGFISVPIHVNDCHYTFTNNTIVNGNYEGPPPHIVCPSGKTIEVTAPGCTVTVSTQTPTGGTITFTNKGSGDTREVEVDVALTGVHYIEHNKGVFPTCSFPTETTTNGTYNGKAIVTGSNAGAHTPIWVE